MSTKERERRVAIRLDLRGDAARRFLLLKERRGLESNTELIRVLISDLELFSRLLVLEQKLEQLENRVKQLSDAWLGKRGSHRR